ncbi:MAG: hypothetical protein KA166_02495 [Saprospiraceae bacterium]|nr:hypothetical protein [Saprospiraceae bacterium]
MTNRIIISLFCSFLIISCQDEDIIPFKPNGCVIDFNLEDKTAQPCTVHSQNCVPTEVSGEFYLIERARKFLPQSCLTIGDKIFYENPEGDILGFTIVSKDHELVRSSYLSIPPCVDMPDYCFKSEIYTLVMKSEDDQYNLSITLQVYVRGAPSSWIQRDGMHIKDLNLPGANIFFLSLYEEFPSSNEYYQSYEVFGKTFTNVYSVEPPNTHEDAIKIFYNSEFGMVSFIDGEGIEWRIVI